MSSVFRPLLSAPRTRRLLVVAVLAWIGTEGASAQGNNQIRITGGTVTLSVVAAVPGQEPTDVTNQNTRLSWGRPRDIAKIVVYSSCPGQSFDLSIEAISLVNGTGTGPVSLFDGMAPMDLVVDMPANQRGEATLRYLATATVDQGTSTENGTDAHTLTFTLVTP